jgi:hypothetical protein
MDAATPPLVPAFELSIASQGMSKGVLQTKDPQFIPRFLLKAMDLQLSAQWKNIDTNNAKGEASVGLGWSRRTKAADVNLSAAYKLLTAHHGAGARRSVEFTGGLSRKFGRLGLKASAVWSPHNTGTGKPSLYVEGGPSFDLPFDLKASIAAGYRKRSGARDYATFNAGLSRPLGKRLAVDLRYFATDSGDEGETYRDRVVASVKLSL